MLEPLVVNGLPPTEDAKPESWDVSATSTVALPSRVIDVVDPIVVVDAPACIVELATAQEDPIRSIAYGVLEGANADGEGAVERRVQVSGNVLIAMPGVVALERELAHPDLLGRIDGDLVL